MVSQREPISASEMANPSDRRSRPRYPQPGGPFRLSYEVRPGVTQVLSAELTDFHEEGCGLEVMIELPEGVPVTVEGTVPDSGGAELKSRAFVSWCAASPDGTFRIGVQFAEPLRLQRDQNNALWKAQNEDLYELLQISPNAGAETIQRVYRLLAQRYHPDNAETADTEMFRKILDAYRTLSDPEKRAAYDARHKTVRERRWKIFDQERTGAGMRGEKAKRDGIIGLLYTKRMNEPGTPHLDLREFEQLLGVPREHLEFSLWYLREQGMVVRGDNGRHQIKAKGVDHAAQTETSWVPADHLLGPATGVGTATEPTGAF
ncbi:MAG: J domain-containing protein [Acidobacteria bacterium]|nr:J domain-containing protein [Acidobacteriota bacterium]